MILRDPAVTEVRVLPASDPLPGRRLDPLGEIRKGMNGLCQIAHRDMCRHRRDNLVNHFTCRRRGDMPAENLPALCVGDELDEALGLGLHQRLPQ